ncbi:MAG: RNA polymerase sigma factor [bacterium]
MKFFPEQQFINRIRSRDRTVLGELFTRYQKLIFNYVTAHGGDQTDAEDVLQEAIIVLWQNVCSGRFEVKSKLSTYLLAVAKNKWRSELRRKKKLSGESLSSELPDGNPTSLQTVIKSEQLKIIRDALNAINPLCKELLMLYYFEERKLKDIAKILGFANEDVAKSKKYQCKKSLEKILKKHLIEAER